MKRITRVVALSVAPCLLALGANGQEVASDGGKSYSPTTDTLQVRQSMYAQLSGVEGYDTIPGDALLPITREQATELITKMIVETRAPYKEQEMKEEAVRRTKMDFLKHRLLDQALRDTYVKEYEDRVNRLETLVYALLLNKGDVNPQVINQLLGTPTRHNRVQYLPYPNNDASTMVPADLAPETPYSAMVQNLKDGNKQPAEATELKQVDNRTTLPIAPGQPLDQIEYFMSQVFFAFDSDKLTGEGKKTLDNVAAWMKQTGNDLAISIHGYASLEGNISYNNKLSGRRVKAVAQYLYEQGIPESRVVEVPAGIDSIKEQKNTYPEARRVDIRPVLF